MATTATAKGKPFDRSIVEGDIMRAVWMIAWPSVLQNVIGELRERVALHERHLGGGGCRGSCRERPSCITPLFGARRAAERALPNAL